LIRRRKLRSGAGRAFLDALELPDDVRERIEVALAMVDAIDAQLAPLERELRQLARRQCGCKALMRLYGMGELPSLVTLCELGDVGRLSASRKAVRMAGIDIGVHRSDRLARIGKLRRPATAARACSCSADTRRPDPHRRVLRPVLGVRGDLRVAVGRRPERGSHHVDRPGGPALRREHRHARV
jgi:transposase